MEWRAKSCSRTSASEMQRKEASASREAKTSEMQRKEASASRESKTSEMQRKEASASREGEEKPTVLVTGFGPFGDIKENSSMVAVNLLKTSDNIKNKVNLVTEEIPVIYDYVHKNVPHLWEKYKPKLCVHVGVHSNTDTVVLESCAHNEGYQRVKDINGSLHQTECCVPGAPDIIKTPLDLSQILTEAKKSKCPCEITLSEDAGRYLCDFTYYMSLHHGDKPAIFVHVPPIEGPYSRKELGDTLTMLVDAMIKQIDLA